MIIDLTSPSLINCVENDRLAVVIDALGNTIGYVYNDRGRKDAEWRDCLRLARSDYEYSSVQQSATTGYGTDGRYDSKGRRATKKVETISTPPGDGERETIIILHQRFLYRGYLQIAACDLTSEGSPKLWHILWDPTQHVATRPLAIQQDDTWYCYGWDLTKNICELFQSDGSIGATYAYAPFGEVTATGVVTQPFQWSSEYHDTELGMVYYNYRHYNPADGRWAKRDPMEGRRSLGLYVYCENNPISRNDILGLYSNQSSAARAAIKKWSELSIKNDIEYCGLICKKKGTSEYTYTEAPGDMRSCFPHDAPCPSCYVEVAFWHTHGSFTDEDGDGEDDRYDTENFSGYPERGAPGDDNYGDLNYAQDYDIDAYLGTPKGSIKMYDHNSNAIYNKKRWK